MGLAPWRLGRTILWCSVNVIQEIPNLGQFQETTNVHFGFWYTWSCYMHAMEFHGVHLIVDVWIPQARARARARVVQLQKKSGSVTADPLKDQPPQLVCTHQLITQRATQYDSFGKTCTTRNFLFFDLSVQVIEWDELREIRPLDQKKRAKRKLRVAHILPKES